MTIQDELLSISYSGRNCLSDGLLWRHQSSCGVVFGLGSLKSSCLRMRLMASEITDFDFVLCSGCVRREITFADGECDCWLVSTSTVAVWTQVARNGHRATRDVRRTTEEQALREALLFRPCWVEDV